MQEFHASEVSLRRRT